MPEKSIYEIPSRSVDLVSLRDVVAPLFRHRRLLTISFLLSFVAVMGFLMTRKGQYQSHLEVLVNRERMDPLVTPEATSEAGSPKLPVTEEEINSEAELIRSQDLLRQVVLANGLQNGKKPGLLGKLMSQPDEAARVDRAVAELDDALKLKNIPKSNMFEVSYSSPNPQQTYGVLNSLGNLYIAKHIAVQRPPGAYEFFARETQRYQDAMNQAEARLRQFGGDGQLAAPELQRSALATQIGSTVGQLNLEQQVLEADLGRIRSDDDKLRASSGRMVTASTSAAPTMLLQQLGAEVLHAQEKLTQLEVKYNADYPLAREAAQELDAAQKAFDKAEKTQYVSETTDNDPTHEMLRQDMARTQSDLAAQVGSLKATRSSLQQMREQLAKLDSAVLQQDDLKREAKADEDSFLLYQAKREQERASDILDRIQIGNVAIAVPPAIPALPVAPRFPALLIAFAFAAITSLVLTYVAAYLDPAVHAPQEIFDILGVPVIVAIPRNRNKAA